LGGGVRAHEPLPHGREAVALLVGEVGEPDLLTRVELRVLADQLLDHAPRLVVEGVVGRRMSANSVFPPPEGTLRAGRIEYMAGTTLNELSECQRRLPMPKSRRRSSRAKTRLSLSRFDTSANVVGRRYSSGARRLVPMACSRLPRARVKASCCSSVSGW